MPLDITTNQILDTIFSETSLPSDYRKALEENLTLRKHTPTPEFVRLLQSVAKLETNEQIKILAAIILAGSDFERGHTAADRLVAQRLDMIEDNHAELGPESFRLFVNFEMEFETLAKSHPDAFARQAFGRFCDRYLTQELRCDDREHTSAAFTNSHFISECTLVNSMMYSLHYVPPSSLEALKTDVLELLSPDNIGMLSNYAMEHVVNLANQFSMKSVIEIGEQLLQGCKQPHIAPAALDGLRHFVRTFPYREIHEEPFDLPAFMRTKVTAVLDQLMVSDKETGKNNNSSICFKAWEVFHGMITDCTYSLKTQIERPALSFDAQEALLRRIEPPGKSSFATLPPILQADYNCVAAVRPHYNGPSYLERLYYPYQSPLADCRHPDLAERVATLFTTPFKEKDSDSWSVYQMRTVRADVKFVLMHHERGGRPCRPEHLERMAGGIDLRRYLDLTLVRTWPRLAAHCGQNVVSSATLLATQRNPKELCKMLGALADCPIRMTSEQAIALQELFENRVEAFSEFSFPREKALGLKFLEKQGLMTARLIDHVCNHMLTNVKLANFLVAGSRAITSKPELLLGNEALCEKVFACLDRTHSFREKGGKTRSLKSRGEALIDAYSYLASSPAFVERYFGPLKARLASLAIGNYSDEITSRAEQMLKSIV